MGARLNLRERLIDPNSPEQRPRRGAYALPALFTAGNLFLGLIAILKAFEGALLVAAGNLGHNVHFENAAKLIGVSVFLDGLDGRIARLTRTESEFGREFDSLADVISFGIAPAVLAWAYGFYFLDPAAPPMLRKNMVQIGYFIVFTFVMCGAARLARFNISSNPIPRNPGRPDRKYFVGLPIPAAAGMIAAVVYAFGSEPIINWRFASGWLALVALLSFLMVSKWRYRSFKDFSLVRPRSPFSVVLLGMFFYLVWNYSEPLMLFLASLYVCSGIVVRFGGIIKRRLFRHHAHPPAPAQHQA